MPNEYSNAPYSLASRKKPKKEPKNNSSIVIESMGEPEKPYHQKWPPTVTSPNDYDPNVYDPYDKNYSHKAGAKEPVKTA